MTNNDKLSHTLGARAALCGYELTELVDKVSSNTIFVLHRAWANARILTSLVDVEFAILSIEKVVAQ